MRVAVLGGGISSAVGRVHSSALGLLPEISVAIGLFSRDLERNSASAERFGLPSTHTCDSFSEFLERATDEVDVAVVLTPTDVHYEHIVPLISAGVPVISEKALTTESKKAVKLASLAEDRKVGNFVIFNYTGYPMVRELRARILLGEIGNILRVRATMPSETFIRVGQGKEPIRPQEWRLRDGNIPTLSLDLGVHLFNLVSFVTGLQFRDVIGVESQFGHFSVVDDTSVIARLGGGQVADLWFSKSSLGHRNGLQIEVYGTRGSLSWTHISPENLVVADRFGSRAVLDPGSPGLIEANRPEYQRFKSGHPSGFIEAFANHYQDVFSSLKTGEKGPYAFSFRDSIAGLRTAEAITQSSASKHPTTRIV